VTEEERKIAELLVSYHTDPSQKNLQILVQHLSSQQTSLSSKEEIISHMHRTSSLRPQLHSALFELTQQWYQECNSTDERKVIWKSFEEFYIAALSKAGKKRNIKEVKKLLSMFEYPQTQKEVEVAFEVIVACMIRDGRKRLLTKPMNAPSWASFKFPKRTTRSERTKVSMIKTHPRVQERREEVLQELRRIMTQPNFAGLNERSSYLYLHALEQAKDFKEALTFFQALESPTLLHFKSVLQLILFVKPVPTVKDLQWYFEKMALHKFKPDEEMQTYLTKYLHIHTTHIHTYQHMHSCTHTPTLIHTYTHTHTTNNNQQQQPPPTTTNQQPQPTTTTTTTTTATTTNKAARFPPTPTNH